MTCSQPDRAYWPFGARARQLIGSKWMPTLTAALPPVSGTVRRRQLVPTVIRPAGAVGADVHGRPVRGDGECQDRRGRPGPNDRRPPAAVQRPARDPAVGRADDDPRPVAGESDAAERLAESGADGRAAAGAAGER